MHRERRSAPQGNTNPMMPMLKVLLAILGMLVLTGAYYQPG